MKETLITTDIASREYARLHQPKSKEELNFFFQEGLRIFSNMEIFDLYYRKASLNDFSMMYLAPMIINYYKSKSNAELTERRAETAQNNPGA